MPQDEKEGGFWSKADSYQPKTPAMKSWKEKYLEGNQSKHGEDEEKPRINNLDDYTNRQLQKENSWNGFIRPLKLFIPLSIISFYNESINGYFCMWGECAPPPPYYYFPRIIALIAVIFSSIWLGRNVANPNTVEVDMLGACFSELFLDS